jgi:hypothetical protein
MRDAEDYKRIDVTDPVEQHVADEVPPPSFRTRGSLMCARSLVITAIEWRGIIASIYEMSDTVSWLLTSHRETANMIAPPTRIAEFASCFRT